MHVAICGAESNQITAIRDFIRVMVEGRSGLSLNSTYGVPTLPGPKDKILIILMPTEKRETDLLEDFGMAIVEKLSLDRLQLSCAREWH